MRYLNHVFPKLVSNKFSGLTVSKYGYYILTILYGIRSFYFLTITDLSDFVSDLPPLASLLLNQTGLNQVIISLIQLWGISQLILFVIFFIVMIRYRSLLSLMYIFLIIDAFIKIVIRINPNVENQDLLLNYVVFFTTIALFILSLIHKKVAS
jgi:hypothetical protein